jgi:hypothetical protein
MSDIDRQREYRELVSRAEKIGMLLITKERLKEISTCACSWEKGEPTELCAAHADHYRELQSRRRDRAAPDGYCVVPVERLESIRIFARDCIDTGHDRGALGNLYAICDRCDAMLASRPTGVPEPAADERIL